MAFGPKRVKMLRIAVQSGVVVLLGLVAFLLDSNRPAKRTIVGLVTLTGADIVGDLEDCSGHEEHQDLEPGRKVIVSDRGGKVLDEATLENFTGEAQYYEQLANLGISFSDAEKQLTENVGANSANGGVVCPIRFETSVKLVNSYSIRIGDRDPMLVRQEELAASNWQVSYGY